MSSRLTSARESVRPDPEVVARAKAEDWARRREAARRRVIRTAERAGIDPAYFLEDVPSTNPPVGETPSGTA